MIELSAEEWIDADEWARHIRRALGDAVASRFVPVDGPPLNYSQAEALANQGGFKFVHLSDGRTLIEVGADNVQAARKA